MIRQSTFNPIMFGRYCLIDQISKGGMSDIYLAKTVGVGGLVGFRSLWLSRNFSLNTPPSRVM